MSSTDSASLWRSSSPSIQLSVPLSFAPPSLPPPSILRLSPPTFACHPQPNTAMEDLADRATALVANPAPLGISREFFVEYGLGWVFRWGCTVFGLGLLIWGLPFENMIEEIRKDIGRKIVRVLEVDKRAMQADKAKFLRI
nr:hypothetical protein CFP56_74138 [Quercus suber]